MLIFPGNVAYFHPLAQLMFTNKRSAFSLDASLLNLLYIFLKAIELSTISTQIRQLQDEKQFSLVYV